MKRFARLGQKVGKKVGTLTYRQDARLGRRLTSTQLPPTPSSSSSSSSSTSRQKEKEIRLRSDEDFRSVWDLWKRHRVEKQKPLGEFEEEQQLYELEKFEIDEAKEIVRYSIGAGARNLITNGDHRRKLKSGSVATKKNLIVYRGGRMNREEWNTFKDKLFIAFPSFFAHINNRSPNPKATLETWFETLADVSFDEASAVIHEWQRGTIEPPKAFELDYIAIVIKARVGFKRSQESRYRTARTLYDEKQRAKHQREQFRQVMPDMENAFLIASAARRRVLDREITEDEYKEICRKACTPSATDGTPLTSALDYTLPTIPTSTTGAA